MRHLAVALLLGAGCSAHDPDPEPQGEPRAADFEAATATELLSAALVAFGHHSQAAIGLAGLAQYASEQSGCPAALGGDAYEAHGCTGWDMVWEGRATLWAEDMDPLWFSPAPDIDLSFESFSATEGTDRWDFDGTYAMQVDETTVREQLDLEGIAPAFASRLRTTLDVDCDVDTDTELVHARDCEIAPGGEGEVEGLGAFGVSGSYHVETENLGSGGSLNLVTRETGRLELEGEQLVVVELIAEERPDGTRCLTFDVDGSDRPICWDPTDGLYTAYDDPTAR